MQLTVEERREMRVREWRDQYKNLPQDDFTAVNIIPKPSELMNGTQNIRAMPK